MDYCSIATETLAFLCEMPKSHDLGHVRGHVIRMSNLPKIAKIDSVRPAVPHYLLISLPLYLKDIIDLLLL
jgi:hypothetical protein